MNRRNCSRVSFLRNSHAPSSLHRGAGKHALPNPPRLSYLSSRRPLRFVAIRPPFWHIAMPSGEGGNHPICPSRQRRASITARHARGVPLYRRTSGATGRVMLKACLRHDRWRGGAPSAPCLMIFPVPCEDGATARHAIYGVRWRRLDRFAPGLEDRNQVRSTAVFAWGLNGYAAARRPARQA